MVSNLATIHAKEIPEDYFVNGYPTIIFCGRVHSLTAGTGEAMLNNRASDQQVRQHVGNNAGTHGRTVIMEFIEPEGYNVPLGLRNLGGTLLTNHYLY